MRSFIYIAYDFAPFANAGSLRCVKFVKYLPNHGWQPLVITARYRYRKGRDDTLLLDLPRSATVRKVTNVEPSVILPERFRQPIVKYMLPDDKAWWTKPAITAAERLVHASGAQVIMATGNPWTSLMVGKKLKDRTDLPLVLDFRDPWTQSADRCWPSARRRVQEESLEAEAIKAADAVIVVTEHLGALMAERYPAIIDKVYVIPNGFDHNDFNSSKPQVPPVRRDTMMLLNMGSIYDLSQMNMLFHTLSKLARRTPALAGAMRVELVGGWWPKQLREMADRHQIGSMVALTPRVSHQEAVARIVAADVLLVFRPQRYAYSAKVFEYLAARRPILAVTPGDGALADLLAQTGGGTVVGPGDAKVLEEALVEMFRRWQAGSLTAVVDDDVVDTYRRDRLAGRLADLLDKVASASTSATDARSDGSGVSQEDAPVSVPDSARHRRRWINTR